MSRVACLIAILALVGCLPLQLEKQPETPQVAGHPFGGEQPTASAIQKVSYAPATQDVAMRVERVGRNLVTTAPQVGLRPYFATIGSPDPEIFHVDLNTVYVTEGLVKQCAGDRELSAVLASEMGRMVAEREARVGKQVRDPERPLPIELPIGSSPDMVSNDPTRMVELARHEKRYPKNRPATRPDAKAVARLILEQAGYRAADFDAVQPLLEDAEKNNKLESQFKGGGPSPSGWHP